MRANSSDALNGHVKPSVNSNSAIELGESLGPHTSATSLYMSESTLDDSLGWPDSWRDTAEDALTPSVSNDDDVANVLDDGLTSRVQLAQAAARLARLKRRQPAVAVIGAVLGAMVVCLFLVGATQLLAFQAPQAQTASRSSAKGESFSLDRVLERQAALE